MKSTILNSFALAMLVVGQDFWVNTACAQRPGEGPEIGVNDIEGKVFERFLTIGDNILDDEDLAGKETQEYEVNRGQEVEMQASCEGIVPADWMDETEIFECSWIVTLHFANGTKESMTVYKELLVERGNSDFTSGGKFNVDTSECIKIVGEVSIRLQGTEVELDIWSFEITVNEVDPGQ